MSIQQLRGLASNDAELCGLLNEAKTLEQLVHIANNRGINLDVDTIDEEVSDEDLSAVTGGMRALGSAPKSMKGFSFNSAKGGHTCNTSTCTECDACGAHTCNTSTCKECNSCGSSDDFSGGTKLSLF